MAHSSETNKEIFENKISFGFLLHMILLFIFSFFSLFYKTKITHNFFIFIFNVSRLHTKNRFILTATLQKGIHLTNKLDSTLSRNLRSKLIKDQNELIMFDILSMYVGMVSTKNTVFAQSNE